MIKLKSIACVISMILFLSPSIMAQCEADSHSTNKNDSWLSCQTSTIPISSESGNYHWIYYDFGYKYTLGTIKIWNYNVINQTGRGVKDGAIFYSENGQNWFAGDTFQIPEASGQNDYAGWEGIDLNGITARFITIVAYSNWGGGDCTGLSEVRFNVLDQTTPIKNDWSIHSEIFVFPNPAYQVLTVDLRNKLPIKELILFDNTGHEILRQSDLDSSFILDVSTFSAGIYYLKILTENHTYLNTKFVKTNR